MNARVFWVPTGEDDDGAWYWIETMETGDDFGDPVGPFSTALLAGVDARKAIVARAEAQSKAEATP